MTDDSLDLSLAPSDELFTVEHFTNRGKELEFLWGLADEATRCSASSYCIVARRGMGKTSLMREFYRQLFTQQKRVVAFFIGFEEYEAVPDRVQLSVQHFTSILFVTFALQYGAFKSGKFSTPPALPHLAPERKEFFAS